MITRKELEKRAAALENWRALLARVEQAEADRDALRGILDRPAAKDIASVIAERDAARVMAARLRKALEYVMTAHGEQLTDAFDHAHATLAATEARDE